MHTLSFMAFRKPLASIIFTCVLEGKRAADAMRGATARVRTDSAGNMVVDWKKEVLESVCCSGSGGSVYVHDRVASAVETG